MPIIKLDKGSLLDASKHSGYIMKSLISWIKNALECCKASSWTHPEGALLILLLATVKDINSYIFQGTLYTVSKTSWVQYKQLSPDVAPSSSVSEHRNPSPPRFNERVNPGPIRTGETIVLSCISQGIPPPTYLWFRESVSGTTMVFNSERIHARAGVLVLQSARVEDAGRYVCHANNTAGSERVELEVTIISSLSIHLAPQQVRIRFSSLYRNNAGTAPPAATGDPIHVHIRACLAPRPRSFRFLLADEMKGESYVVVGALARLSTEYVKGLTVWLS